MRLEDALFVAVPFALFFGGAFVVFGLAFGEGNFSLDQVVFPVDFGTHAGIAFLLYLGHQFVDFTAFQQQLAGALRVGDKMGGSGLQRRDQCA